MQSADDWKLKERARRQRELARIIEPEFRPGRVLVVGDNLSTDMGGGAAAGTDTAWYNPAGLPLTGDVVPTWQVARLEELIPLVLDRIPPEP